LLIFLTRDKVTKLNCYLLIYSVLFVYIDKQKSTYKFQCQYQILPVIDYTLITNYSCVSTGHQDSYRE